MSDIRPATRRARVPGSGASLTVTDTWLPAAHKSTIPREYCAVPVLTPSQLSRCRNDIEPLSPLLTLQAGNDRPARSSGLSEETKGFAKVSRARSIQSRTVALCELSVM